MIRDSQRSKAYWDEWIEYKIEKIREWLRILKHPSGDPGYRPQFVFELVKKNYELMLEKYSRGDEMSEMARHFPGLLDAWEESERLGRDVWSEQIQYTRYAWEVNLDHYVRCFWLTGLALTFDIPDEQWLRLVELMGNQGEDALLDRVIASRQPDRKIGNKLCFPQAYDRLLQVVDAPIELRPKLLRDYLDGWFPGLKDAGSPSFPREHRTPYWWDFCTEEGRQIKGGYFGCWCIEAVAVAKAFDIDDSLCLDHPHYPGDLILDGRSPRYTDTEAAAASEAGPDPLAVMTSPRSQSWLARWLGKP